MEPFHFLRPLWLLGLPLLALLSAWLWRRRARGHWGAVCDPQLLPHLLLAEGARAGALPVAAFALAGTLALLALAGPAWRQLEQPVFQDRSPLVLVLDLSRSMDATDLRPSRLERARLKLLDILAARREGESALLVYAAAPFVVTPLTDDGATIANQLRGLETGLMPAQGSRADLAVAKAVELLRQAGAARGDILLITDGDAAGAAEPLRGGAYRLSVLGVGSAEGAPVPLAGGGYLKDAAGAIVLPRLDEPALQRLAAAGGGLYRRLATDDTDVRALLEATGGRPSADARPTTRQADRWHEEGPWLLLPLLPLAALAFRRGLLALPLLLVLGLPDPAHAFGWRDLWLRPDQQGAQALAQGQPEAAAGLFQDRRWQAAARYRAGQYEEALKAADGLDGADDWYNRGNALARLGRLPEAARAYDEALARDPRHVDAGHNRDLVRQALERQQQPQSGDKGEQEGQSQQQQQAAEQPQPGDTGDNGAQPPEPARADQGQEAPEHSDQAQEAVTATDNAPVAESEQAREQWLRRIPDDPGGLLRRKFLYQYRRQNANQPQEPQPW